MSIIENFNLLSEDELLQFTNELIQKINTEKIFTDEFNFTIAGVEPDELSGDLLISVDHDEEYIVVPRKADWQPGPDAEDNYDPDPDADYRNSGYKDAESIFKTLKVELDGYKLELAVDDYEDVGLEGVTEGRIYKDDAGIGSYEYGDYVGYDSRPYEVVEDGTIYRKFVCYMSISVEPIK